MTRNICIFSDGTGQRGVRVDDGATNIFKLYEWARDVPDQVCFYDPGVGSEPGKGLDWTTWARNLVDKSTGLGITRNIHDCYDFLVRSWREDSRVAVFGFSRGAYTVRSLASAVMLCGVPDRLQDGLDITGDEPPAKALRSRLLSEAIGIYQSHYGPRGAEERKAKARHYRERYRCHDAPVHLVAVFDTVAALGLPGIANLANPLRHRFHDAKLSGRVRFGFQALAQLLDCELVLRRHLLRAQVLLHRHREVGAALHRGVVGDQHAQAPADGTDARHHAGTRRHALVQAGARDPGVVDDGAAGALHVLDVTLAVLVAINLLAFRADYDGAART